MEQFVQRQQKSLQQAVQSLEKAQARQAKYADMKRAPNPEFKVGQLVLLNSRNLVSPPDSNRPKKKLLASS